ncbi:MAG: type II toxin-antitoxin system HicB family antitoxin [Bacillota bacterium]|nr:type II toxin-antitoxin system HicB family antitoxin [Bacillota bacterium]
MLYSYPAVFHKEDGRYWVEFPDLPGCFSQGDSVKEVLANAKESMELYLEPTEPFENPLRFPEPTDISTLETPENGFLSYVTSDVDFYKFSKSVKKTLTIPAWVNEEAEAAGINFSQALREALIERLSRI